jgi:hypothetical protein
MGQEAALMEMLCTIRQNGALLKGKAPAVVQAGLDSAMYEATSFLEAKVKAIVEKEGRMGVGGSKVGLYKSIAGEVEGKGTPLIKGIVFSNKSYVEVIEKGRRPGKAWPPEGVMLQWIQLKMGLSGKRGKEVEFLIRRKIGIKGFPGIRMFERAFTENRNKIQKMFENAGFDISAKLSEGGM